MNMLVVKLITYRPFCGG